MSVDPVAAQARCDRGLHLLKEDRFDEALIEFRAAAEMGNVRAINCIGVAHQNGQGVPVDYAEGLRWYQRAADMGSERAMYNVGVCHHHGQGVTKDAKKAFEWYQRAADKGYELAMHELGVCYQDGDGVARDAKKAVAWYQRAADKGNEAAMCNLGMCLQDGDGVAKDAKKAVAWYQRAADKDHEPAMYNLGLCYQDGDGVAKDMKKAAEWYQRAAFRGHELAMYNLGVCYRNGDGVAKDTKKAAEWFQRAADEGNELAMNNLGLCYRNGVGVAKDSKKAVEWFQRAADKGLEMAMNNLGVCYRDGDGVAKDAKKAVEWEQRAAGKGPPLTAPPSRASQVQSGGGFGAPPGPSGGGFAPPAARSGGFAPPGGPPPTAGFAPPPAAAFAPPPATASAPQSQAQVRTSGVPKPLPLAPAAQAKPQGSPSVSRAVQSAVGSVSTTQLVGGFQWINEKLQSLEFESDQDREQAREWMMKTFKTSTSVALQVVGAVDEIVAAAKVVTVVLRVAMAIAEAHERAKANDVRVAQLCARLNELRVIMEQMRDSLAEQAANVVSGKATTSTAKALRAPLDRLLGAVKAARDAIDAWQEVSRATGADKWAKFKRWAGRVVKSSAHADTLVEANDELQSALQQIGAVASIRAALNTAGGADDDLKAWLQQNAERDDAFRTALQQDASEIKQRLANLLPEIDKLLTRHLSGVNEKLDQLLGANIDRLPFESFDLQSERSLGEGAYGAIVAMRCKKLGRAPVAVKKLVLSSNAAEDKKRKERLREEARLMNQFKHQHIVQFYGQVVTPANDVWLVMELLDKSLEKFIAELAGDQSKWPMDDRKRVAHEIALGLEYLHGKNVLHRDLKSPNVMLTAVERHAKLIDFGLSKDTNSAKNKSATIQGSSSLWMAPEINGNDDFSQASDVYAFGIVLTEIVLLELPSMSTLRKVSKMTGEWRELIDQCTEEPNDRPTAAQCAEKLNF